MERFLQLSYNNIIPKYERVPEDHWFFLAVEDGLSVRIFSAPFFLATKLDDFVDRGENDELIKDALFGKRMQGFTDACL
jgi:hypothetical protein